MPLFVAVLLVALAYVGRGVRDHRRHRREVLRVEHRIHVNGVRGKSSVTRLVAASLREAGMRTAAKTTGTAARLVIDHTTDAPIPRREPNIAEQRRVLTRLLRDGGPGGGEDGDGYRAVVFECMAVNPIYQRYLEEKVMRSTIGVITNVREDHTDVLGRTLVDIARSLCTTVPDRGHLVTAETDEDLLAVLRDACDRRQTKIHEVGDTWVDPEVLAGFGHVEHRANVAVALKVAELVGVDRTTALAGMHRARPDPGACTLRTLVRDDAVIHWANLFAVNDRESFVLIARDLAARVGPGARRAVILNNRSDRPERVAQFVDIAVNELEVDHVLTFGSYEWQVRQEVGRSGRAGSVAVTCLGDSTGHRHAPGDELLARAVAAVGAGEWLLLGAANLHTAQARAFLGAVEA